MADHENDNKIQRLNYFTGQFLEAGDFQAEQNYHIGMRHLANRIRYSAGILNDGFRVTKKPDTDKTIEIGAGVGVDYDGKEAPGTIVIDSGAKFLYLVEGNGKARRYGVGTAKSGFEWKGTHKITQKREWPEWRPPAEMIERVKREEGRTLPVLMAGGPANPLGARALYLGSTLYRIHGTNAPWTIGGNVSSGCIRMRNEDVSDLYDRVKVGTRVIMR